MNSNHPLIAGVAQYNPKAAGLTTAPEPLAMMDLVARAAAEDSGAPDLLKSIDAIAIPNIASARYHNAPDALAVRLGINPKRKIYTTFGGNTPQYLLNHLAGEIAGGKLRAAMVVGAEAIYTERHAKKSGAGTGWDLNQGTGKPEVMGDPRMGSNAYEDRHGARMPIQIYPMFENAFRARNRWTLAQHRERLGQLWSSLSKVAAANPYAWFRSERSAAEIATATPDNRIICFPYTKVMNAIMEVDLAAAVILTSESEARRLGIPDHKRVYIHSAADATDGWWISNRASLDRAPMLQSCVDATLTGASIASTDVSHFDFYSCFPIAVELAMEALGMQLDDPRGFSVTGGLPFAGGPANNYVTHSIAAMTSRLRANPGQFGMTTGLGWYFTKHAAAIYNTERPTHDFSYAAFKEPSHIDVAAIEHAEGPATVETYTVEHDRSGQPSAAIVAGRLATGERFFARTRREILADIEREEFVGRSGQVRNADGINLFVPS